MSHGEKIPQLPDPRYISSVDEGFSRYFFDPLEAGSARSVRLLVDGGAVFPVSSIFWRRPSSGWRWKFTISPRIGRAGPCWTRSARAARRGVPVRVVFDSLGSFPNSAAFFEPLVTAGGAFVEYHPISWRDRIRLHRRDHRKMILADDVAIVGGLNIADDYLAGSAQGGFHDLAMEIRGPVVSAAWRLFERTWIREATDTDERSDLPTPSGGGSTQIVGNNHILERWRLRRRFLHALHQARRSVDVINPYFLPAQDMSWFLRRAVKRGVKVRVIVPEQSDVRAVDLASMVIQQRYLRRGVEVWRYPGRLHAKAILVRRHLVFGGKLQLRRSEPLSESRGGGQHGGTLGLGRAAAGAGRDIRLSRRLTRRDWKKLAWWERLLCRAAHQLRRFL